MHARISIPKCASKRKKKKKKAKKKKRRKKRKGKGDNRRSPFRANHSAPRKEKQGKKKKKEKEQKGEGAQVVTNRFFVVSTKKKKKKKRERGETVWESEHGLRPFRPAGDMTGAGGGEKKRTEKGGGRTNCLGARSFDIGMERKKKKKRLRKRTGGTLAGCVAPAFAGPFMQERKKKGEKGER